MADKVLNDMDVAVVLRAQTRILRLKRRRSWREVADVLAERGGLEKLNVKYVFNFVMKNEVPTNPDIRHALGLPRVMPSERPVRVRRQKKLMDFPAFQKVAREEVLAQLEFNDEK